MGIDDDNGAGTPAGPDDYPAAENTDTHLWPITTAWDAPDEGSIHVTAGGGIGITVAGHCIVKPLRDGSHFLALERVGIEDTDRHVLEWREIWYEPSRAFFGPTMWMSEAGAAQFGEDCFAGWLPLPNKHGAK